MHKLITSDNRHGFDNKVKQHLNDGWSVVQGTMYAATVNASKKETEEVMKTNTEWENNLFAVFLQGYNHQVLITAQNHDAFDRFVNTYLESPQYEVIPGTIYATALEEAKDRTVTPYVSVTLQKHG